MAQWGLCLIAVAIATFTTTRKFREALSQERWDLDHIFIPAGIAIKSGVSPWSVVGYVHPPFEALLIALFDTLKLPVAQTWICLSFIAALTSCALITMTFVRERVWLSILFFCGCLITIMSSRAMHAENILGQSDLFILCLLCLGIFLTSRSPFWHGFFMVSSGAIKLWPFAFGASLIQRTMKLKEFIGAICAGLVALLGTVLLGLTAGRGANDPLEMVTATKAFTTQRFPSYSTLRSGRALFSYQDLVIPIADSSTLATLTTTATTALVLLTLILGMARITDRRYGVMVSMIGAIVILLPVSHIFYLFFYLPIVWYWVSAVIHERRLIVCIPALLSAIWWLIAMHHVFQPVKEPSRSAGVISSTEYLVRFFLTFILVTSSMLFSVFLPVHKKSGSEPLAA
ncbi:MAG: glycosyltransferase 87 family protein [Cutibacterium avidum]|nr:glycosyltransferase 87 family protein [Cutibacterium avidum]